MRLLKSVSAALALAIGFSGCVKSNDKSAQDADTNAVLAGESSFMFPVFLKHVQGQAGRDLICFYKADKVAKKDIENLKKAGSIKDLATLKPILLKANSLSTQGLWYSEFYSKLKTQESDSSATASVGLVGLMSTILISPAALVALTVAPPLAIGAGVAILVGTSGAYMAKGIGGLIHAENQTNAVESAKKDQNYDRIIQTNDKVLLSLQKVVAQQVNEQAAYPNQAVNNVPCPSKETLIQKAVIAW